MRLRTISNALAIGAFAIAVPAWSADGASATASVVVRGENGNVQTFDAKNLSQLPQHTVSAEAHGKKITCDGPNLIDVLARVDAPQGEAIRGTVPDHRAGRKTSRTLGAAGDGDRSAARALRRRELLRFSTSGVFFSSRACLFRHAPLRRLRSNAGGSRPVPLLRVLRGSTTNCPPFRSNGSARRA